MSQEAFEAAIAEAKKLEKKMVEYSPYDGDIEIEKSVDMEPPEYVDIDYKAISSMYQRTQKILSARGMGILAEGGAEEVKVSAKSQEVETRLKELSSARMKEAEEIAKEPAASFEEAPELEKETPAPEALEIEREAPAREIEFEAAETPEEETAAEEPEIPFKEAAEKEIPSVEEEKPAVPLEEEAAPKPPPKAIVPPTLRETPDQAAERRYQQIEEQIRGMLGEEADELALKKKMLDLTKQLFKEKTTSRREEIKLQIKVLKNMLTASREGGRKKRGASQTRFDTILATQQEELAHTKGKVIDTYNKQIMAIKERYYQDMGGIEDADERKKTYEKFVSSVTMLVHDLPEAVKKEQEFVSKKHTAELDRLAGALEPKEKALLKRIDERKEYIEQEYDGEFSMVKHIVGREIENLIEVAGAETFRKPEEETAKRRKKLDPMEIVKEINETDEGTLLYFLHSKEPEHYKKFERKQISKGEAVFKAKELLAKEKGLSDSMIKKYFSIKED